MITPAAAPLTDAVVGELLACGIIGAEDAASPRLQTEEVSASHRSYLVTVDGARRFFVKKADPVRSQGRNLLVEAAVYGLAATTPNLAAVMPRCLMISGDASMIVLEAAPRAFLDQLRWPEIGAADADLLGSYGATLAAVHSVRPIPLGPPPWLLTALEPGWGGHPWLPSGCRLVLADLAARPHFRVGFRSLRRSWRPSVLIHGDLRWSNVLIAGAWTNDVLLVDWELACRGDPAWDVGSVIADLLALNVLDRPNSMDLEQLAGVTAAFLAGYRDAGRWTPAMLRVLLVRSVAMAAANLVRTVLEYGYVGDAELSAAESSLLPWSERLLVHAHSFAIDLERALARPSER